MKTHIMNSSYRWLLQYEFTLCSLCFIDAIFCSCVWLLSNIHIDKMEQFDSSYLYWDCINNSYTDALLLMFDCKGHLKSQSTLCDFSLAQVLVLTIEWLSLTFICYCHPVVPFITTVVVATAIESWDDCSLLSYLH